VTILQVSSSLLLASGIMVALPAPARAWPEGVKDVRYPCSADDTLQPAMYYDSGSEKAKPLLVALHPWGGSYDSAAFETPYARWCMEKDWVFMHPHFRGPNGTPQTTGSELVVQDIVDAVAYARATSRIDPDRVYCMGFSGGGHAALLMAGHHPHLWAGVSAWCPIADLRSWWAFHRTGQATYYAKAIERACGGPPGAGAEVDEEYRKRSPVTWLREAAGVPLDINGGLFDVSVPFTEAAAAFNCVVAAEDRIPANALAEFAARKEAPERLNYRREQQIIAYRKAAGNTRLTVYHFHHNVDHRRGLTWLSKQVKGRPAVWP
jgi:poly(3-hydroxybutyrate) depolymerase